MRPLILRAGLAICLVTVAGTGRTQPEPVVRPVGGGRQPPVVPAAKDGPEVPADRAVLGVELPKGATATLDGTDLGEKRRIEFDKIKPGELLRRELVVKFAAGGEEKRTLLLRGGWHVRVVVDPPGTARPEIVPQTGHASEITSLVLSPDGKRLVTGSTDATALVWDAATGRQLRQYRGHTAAVMSVSLSADGKYLLTGSADGTAIVHEVETGKVIHRLTGFKGGVFAVAFDPKGKSLYVGAAPEGLMIPGTVPFQADRVVVVDATTFKPTATLTPTYPFQRMFAPPDGGKVVTGGAEVTIWDANAGKKLASAEVYAGWSATHPDGKRLLLGGQKATLWDVAAGKAVKEYDLGRTLGGLASGAEPVALHPTADLALLKTQTDTGAVLVLLDLKTGKEVNNWPLKSVIPRPVGAFTADGKEFLTADGEHGNSVAVYDTATGKPVRRFTGATRRVTQVGTGAKGGVVGAAHNMGGGCAWDVRTGRLLRSFPSAWVSDVAGVSHDETRFTLAASDFQGQVGAIEYTVATGEKVRTFPTLSATTDVITYSPDGKHLVLAGQGATFQLWNAETGKRVRAFKLPEGELPATAVFTADGKHLLAGTAAITVAAAHLLDVESGEVVRTVTPPKPPGELVFLPAVKAVAIDSRVSRIVTGSQAYMGQRWTAGTVQQTTPAILWDAKSGKTLHELKGHAGVVNGATFTPDDRLALTAGSDGLVIAWDAETGQKVREFRGHTDRVNGVVALAGGRRIATGSDDGTVRVWDLATGDELVRLYHLNDGKDWLAITPEGLFDGSAGGRELVGFRDGNGLRVEPVDRFFQDFFRPGLLTAGKGGERPRPDTDFTTARPPTVKFTTPPEGWAVTEPRAVLVVEAADEGGGVQGPVLFHDGNRVVPKSAERVGTGRKVTYEVALVRGDNVFEARASTGDGGRSGDPARLTLRYEKEVDKPQLFVITAGVNAYADGALNLKYAAPDAKAVADLFRTRGGALYQAPQVETLADEKATRAAIREAIAGVAKRARPQDTLVVFLAGHGTMVGQRYYFLPHEFKATPGGSGEDDVRKQGLAGDELADLMSGVPALKRVLVLDTCHSGGAVVGKGGRNPFAFRKDIVRLNRATGVFAIAAASAGDEAKEVDDLGHGVLTYALLAGLRGVTRGPLEEKPISPASPEGVADVLEWFQYAAGHVPQLTRKYFGQEQDIQFSSEGKNFPLLPLREK